MTTFYRTLEVERGSASEAERTAPCVVSTEFPVERGGYREVLSHAPAAVDLSRAPLPLVEGHDAAAVNVGLVEALHLDGAKLRGTIRLGRSTRGGELWRDINAGIVRNLSIGYEVKKTREVGTTVLVTRWMPFEVSLVGAPADPHAGLFRNYHAMPTHENRIEDEQVEHLSRSRRRALAAGADEREQTFSNILELGKYALSRVKDDANPGFRAEIQRMTDDAAVNGRPFDEFRAAIWGVLSKRAAQEPGISSPSDFGISHQDARPYSLVNAIRAASDPRFSGAGYELEVSQGLARQTGRRSQGILVPLGMIGSQQQRAISTGGTGAYLVPAGQGEFIDILRARSVVLSLGVRPLAGLRGDVAIPRKTGASSAYWVGEGQDVTESGLQFGSIGLSPRTVGGLVPFTHKMLMQSSPDIEQLVRSDLAGTIAEAIDRAAIAGAGAANEPLGLLGSGVNVTPFTHATTPTFAAVVGLEGRIAGSSADALGMAYLTTPAIMAALKVTDVTPTGVSGRFAWTAGSEPGRGTLNGLPAHYTASVPAGHLILGDWSQMVYATWGILEIAADPGGANFASGSVSVRALMDIDFGIRHAQSFEVLAEAAG